MKTFTENQLSEISEFLGNGYSAKNNLPGNLCKVKVITNKFNTYTCTFQLFLGNKIWESKGRDLSEKEETVLAWKYL